MLHGSSRRAPKTHSHCLGAALQAVAHQALNVPTLAESTFPVQIYDFKLSNPPRISSVHEDWFYLAIGVDGEIKTTSPISKVDSPWEEVLNFNARGSSLITLRIFTKRMLHDDAYVGSIHGMLDTFLSPASKANTVEGLTLHHSARHHDNDTVETKISFSIKRIERGQPLTEPEPTKHCTELPDDSRRSVVDSARPKQALVGLALSTITTVIPSENQIQEVVNNVNTLSPLLDKLDIFHDLTKTIGDIHPYVGMASIILRGMVKVLGSPLFLMRSMKNAMEAMSDAHNFLSEANALAKINSHFPIVTALAAETVKCGQFLRDVKESHGFTRLLNHLFIADIERKAKGYIQKFQELKTALHEHAAISTATVVQRMYEESAQQMRTMTTQICLNDMPYAKGVNYTSTPAAVLDSHQQRLVEEICSWIAGNSAERIYFLDCDAKSTRTSIARQVAQLHDTNHLKWLGSSYFVHGSGNFHEQHDPRTPQNLFCTISRDIADHDAEFMTAIGETISKRSIRMTSDIHKQFESFILSPARKMTSTEPIVIVIDSLESCGDSISRQPLLEVLGNDAKQLPANFHIVITSGPSPDIMDAFKDRRHVVVRSLDGTPLQNDDSGNLALSTTRAGHVHFSLPLDGTAHQCSRSLVSMDSLRPLRYGSQVQVTR